MQKLAGAQKLNSYADAHCQHGRSYFLFGSTRSRPERSQRVNVISPIPTTRLGSEKRSTLHLPWLTYTTVFWGAEEHATMAELVWHLSTVGPARPGGLAPHPGNPHKLRCELVPEDEDGLGAQACRRSRCQACAARVAWHIAVAAHLLPTRGGKTRLRCHPAPRTKHTPTAHLPAVRPTTRLMVIDGRTTRGSDLDRQHKLGEPTMSRQSHQ